MCALVAADMIVHFCIGANDLRYFRRKCCPFSSYLYVLLFYSYSVSLHHAGKLDMLTGKVLQSVDIDPKLFGEGIVYMEDTVRTTT